MKLIYQYMLGFLVTIVICLGIISAAILGYSRQLAYQQTWKQLEGYSDSLERIALKVDPHTGAYHNLTPKTIDTAQQVLANQKVKIVVFNKISRASSLEHFFISIKCSTKNTVIFRIAFFCSALITIN